MKHKPPENGGHRYRMECCRRAGSSHRRWPLNPRRTASIAMGWLPSASGCKDAATPAISPVRPSKDVGEPAAFQVVRNRASGLVAINIAYWNPTQMLRLWHQTCVVTAGPRIQKMIVPLIRRPGVHWPRSTSASCCQLMGFPGSAPLVPFPILIRRIRNVLATIFVRECASKADEEPGN